MNNIGLAYYSKEAYDKAIEYCEQALAIERKKLGDDHPDVAASLNNIGVAYRNKGDYDKAIEYYEQSLAIRRKKLGPGHPDTVKTAKALRRVRELKKSRRAQ